jgi:uncharacterized protein (TIGR02147 family)
MNHKYTNEGNTELPDTFAEYLKQELLRRHRDNPRYSLRSFAATLDLSSSFLSKILNGKRSITEKTFLKISKRLNLNMELLEKYNPAITMNLSQTLNLKTVQSQEISNEEFKRISLDQFQLISAWYHFAILELVTLSDFQPHPNSIAAKLNISPLEAKEALERLLRLGLLRETKPAKHPKNTKLLLSNNNTTIGPAIATPATTAQQEGILNLAIKALHNIPIEQRSQTSMTMAIPKNRIHEAQACIHEFRQKMTGLLQRKGKRDSVYQLSISFFPLTKN